MKKFLLKAIYFIIPVLGLIFILVITQDPELIVGRKKTFVRIDDNRNYNLLVLGSSRAKYSFNPMVYTGSLKIFNMGDDGHGLPTSYLMLKIMVEKYHLKIDTVLLEIDEFSFSGSTQFSRQFRDDYFVTDLDDEEVFEAFKQYRGSTHAQILKHFPQAANLMYNDFYKFIKNQTLSLKKFIPKIKRTYIKQIREVVKEKGYRPLRTYQNVPLIAEKITMEQDDKDYFFKLVNLCKKHNIRMYFFRAPILRYDMKESSQFDAFIDSFTVANNIPFFDYKSQYQWADQYFDQNHPTGTITPLLTKDILSRMHIK